MHVFCVYVIVKVFREEKKQLCDTKLKICLHYKFIFICFAYAVQDLFDVVAFC